MLSLCLACAAAGSLLSCSEQDVQRWEQFWAASQPATQPTTAESMDDDEPLDEMTRLRLQRDRLLAANRRLERSLEDATARMQDLARQVESLQGQARTQADALDSQRSQLRRAIEDLRHRQDEWETTLAERQRQIDMLTNQVERLSRPQPAAQPGKHAQ